ncbi:MAG: HD domain-containing protein [Bacillota bacterium]|nr:HD domain-containing protein [Bacillota bacterium]
MDKIINILIVDDDEMVGKAMIRILKQIDVNAQFTVSPSEAAQIIKNEDVDLLITDYMMPEINGLDLLTLLKQKHTESLGMLITGFNDFSVAVSAINQGKIVHFFTKPFDNEELKKSILSAIETLQERYRLKALKSWRINFDGDSHQNDVMASIQRNVVEGLTHLLEAKDNELYSHSYRVANLARRFGMYLKFDQEDVTHLEVGGLLHDIGKLAIKDQILDKPAKLDYNEFVNMKRHPVVGAELLEKLGVHERVVNCVRHHHEYVNGKGYPDGLNGNDIQIDSKIISIIDAYDALRSSRPYKEGYDFETTQVKMNQMVDVIYDKFLLDQFFKMLSQETFNKGVEYDSCIVC